MSNFYNIHDNKEIVQEAISEYEVATEGWGTVAALILGAYTGGLSSLAVSVISLDKLRKLMANPVIQKYIAKTCEEHFKKFKKHYKNITLEIPKETIKSFFFRKRSNDNTFLEDMKNAGKDRFTINNKYEIIAYGDTDHIEAVFLLLYNPDTDTLYRSRIPAPTKKELQDAGYRQEG